MRKDSNNHRDYIRIPNSELQGDIGSVAPGSKQMVWNLHTYWPFEEEDYTDDASMRVIIENCADGQLPSGGIRETFPGIKTLDFDLLRIKIKEYLDYYGKPTRTERINEIQGVHNGYSTVLNFHTSVSQRVTAYIHTPPGATGQYSMQLTTSLGAYAQIRLSRYSDPFTPEVILTNSIHEQNEEKTTFFLEGGKKYYTQLYFIRYATQAPTWANLSWQFLDNPDILGPNGPVLISNISEVE